LSIAIRVEEARHEAAQRLAAGDAANLRRAARNLAEAPLMVDRAAFEPFPTAAFVSILVGIGVCFWSSIGPIMAGLLGLGFGAAAAVLSKNSQLVFEPNDASTAEKRRFLRTIAIFQIAITPLLITAFAYVLPKVTGFIFPTSYVLREPAILYYLGGLSIVFGVVFFVSSRKFT
jgi:hypothetical protein